MRSCSQFRIPALLPALVFLACADDSPVTPPDLSVSAARVPETVTRWEVPSAEAFSMPVGDEAAGLQALSVSAWPNDYPRITYPGNTVGAPSWYVAVAFNRNQWLSGGPTSDQLANYVDIRCRNVRPDNLPDFHTGEDWNGVQGGDTDQGEEVRAIADGLVLISERAGSYGNMIILAHRLVPSDELVLSVYAHLDPGKRTVRKGSEISRGEQIGRVGKSGLKSGFAHLHFELRKESFIRFAAPDVLDLADPLKYSPRMWPACDHNVGGDNGSSFIAQNYIDPSSFLALRGGSFSVVDAGAEYTCGLLADGTAYCWGRNDFGQLGVGTTSSPVTTPAPVSGGLQFVTLSAGGRHTCGIATDGNTYCWGLNHRGQLGDGSGNNQLLPAKVATTEAFVAVSAGADYTCSLTADGRAFCWGDNSQGQLGIGSWGNTSQVPIQVQSSSVFGSIASGEDHTCGVVQGGAAYCWGLNTRGQLGAGSTSIRETAPVPMAGSLTFASVSPSLIGAGTSGFTCGVTSGGAGYCWGLNATGQLGNGSTVNSNIPVAVSGGLSFQTIEAGGFHACGVATDGSAYCWGLAAQGQLGDGSSGSGVHSDVPVKVAATVTIGSVTSGYVHSCATASDGNTYCWGDNSSGQLGDGTTTASAVPVTVASP